LIYHNNIKQAGELRHVKSNHTQAVPPAAPVPDAVEVFILHKDPVVFRVGDLLEFRLGALLDNEGLEAPRQGKQRPGRPGFLSRTDDVGNISRFAGAVRLRIHRMLGVEKRLAVEAEIDEAPPEMSAARRRFINRSNSSAISRAITRYCPRLSSSMSARSTPRVDSNFWLVI
jgi:hypothetical protein